MLMEQKAMDYFFSYHYINPAFTDKDLTQITSTKINLTAGSIVNMRAVLLIISNPPFYNY